MVNWWFLFPEGNCSCIPRLQFLGFPPLMLQFSLAFSPFTWSKLFVTDLLQFIALACSGLLSLASTRVTLSCSINKRGAGAPVASLYTERSYLRLLKTLVLHQMQMGVSVWAAESEIWSWNTGELGLAGSLATWPNVLGIDFGKISARPWFAYL